MNETSESHKQNGSNLLLTIISVILLCLLAVNTYWVAFDIKERKKYETSHYKNIEDMLGKREYLSTLDYCDRLLRSDPQNADAMWGRAVSFYYMERWTEATEAFRNAKQIRPEWTKVADEYIEACNRQGVSEITQIVEDGTGQPATRPESE